MNVLNNDQVTTIATAGPFLDLVEAALRNDSKEKLADLLEKFQQDTGLNYEKDLHWYNTDNSGKPTALDEQVKLIDSQFKPATIERMNTLFQRIMDTLSNQNLKSELGQLINKVLNSKNIYDTKVNQTPPKTLDM